ncbi:MAG: hypothetical protein R2867_44930 [Caldilineaceae bacterium]
MSERKYPEWMGKMLGLTADEITLTFWPGRLWRVATIGDDGFRTSPRFGKSGTGHRCGLSREKSTWIKHIQANSNVAVSCALDVAPYTRLVMKGKAEIIEGPTPMAGKCLEVANRMAVRYLGERGPEYLVPTNDRPRYLVQFTPSKTISWEGVEWHEKYLDK